jgi:uncharacterized protein YbjT (DUF2867 family)
MILVTGGTGFIGQALLRHLVEAGNEVRTLIRPSKKSPNLPKGVSFEVAVSSLADERGLRGAMAGVKTVYHLASGEWEGPRSSLLDIDIQGTRAVAKAALDAGVDRIIFLSHLGADRASAYPVLKQKRLQKNIFAGAESITPSFDPGLCTVLRMVLQLDWHVYSRFRLFFSLLVMEAPCSNLCG